MRAQLARRNYGGDLVCRAEALIEPGARLVGSSELGPNLGDGGVSAAHRGCRARGARPPGPGDALQGRVIGVAKVGKDLGLVGTVAGFPEQAEGAGIAVGRLRRAAEVVRGIAEAVPVASAWWSPTWRIGHGLLAARPAC